MNNKTTNIGSILAVALMMFIPSISAINIDSIKNEEKRIYNYLDNLKGFPEMPDKFPLLFIFVTGVFCCRFIRGYLWWDFSIEYGDDYPGQIDIIHPFGFIRAGMLLLFSELWLLFWLNISDKLDWNWNL